MTYRRNQSTCVEVYEKYIVYWKWILASVLIALCHCFFYLRTQLIYLLSTTTLLVVDHPRVAPWTRCRWWNSWTWWVSEFAVDGEQRKWSAEIVGIDETCSESTGTTHHLQHQRFSAYYRFVHRFALLCKKWTAWLWYSWKKHWALKLHAKTGQYTIEGEYNDSAFSQTVKKLPAMINTPAGPISIALRKGLKFLPQNEITVTISNPNAVGRSISANLLTTEVSKQVDVINIGINVSNEQKERTSWTPFRPFTTGMPLSKSTVRPWILPTLSTTVCAWYRVSWAMWKVKWRTISRWIKWRTSARMPKFTWNATTNSISNAYRWKTSWVWSALWRSLFRRRQPVCTDS